MTDAANGAAPKPQQVIFATPTLSFGVCIEYHLAMLQTSQILTMKGIDHGWQHVGGDQFIWKARNRLVTECLNAFPDMTDLFMIDDDVGFPPLKVLEFLQRPEAVIAGVYPKKNQHNEFPVELCVEDARLVERDGLFKASSIPAGFLRIKRYVLETLAAAAPKYTEPDAQGQWAERHYIFEAGVVNGKVLTEDAIFCQKWRDQGGEIWVDPNILFTHRGRSVWSGALASMINDHLERHPENAPLGTDSTDGPDAFGKAALALATPEGRA